jgi:RNA polymerase sigma factor (sigma-70 family)
MVEYEPFRLDSLGLLIGEFVNGCDMNEIIALHGPMIYRTCLRILGDQAAAEDATQATLIIFCKKAQSVTHSVPAFLHGIAVNVAKRSRDAEHLRRKREKEAADVLERERADSQTKEAVSEEIRQHLDEAVEKLPARQRQAVILHYLEGHTQLKSALSMGISRGAFDSYLRRAVEHLRRKLSVHAALSTAAVLLNLQAAADAAYPAGLAEAATIGSPKAAAALANETMKVLFLAKAKIVAVAVTALAMLSLTVTIAVRVLDDSHSVPPPSHADESRRSPLPAGALVRLGAEPTLRVCGLLYSGTFSPDGRLFLTPHGHFAYLFAVDSGTRIATLKSDVRYLGAAAFSPDGNIIYLAGGEEVEYDAHGMHVLPGTGEGVLEAWDVATKQRLWSATVGDGRIERMVVSPSAKSIFAWCTLNGIHSVHLVNLAERRAIWRDDLLPACAFTPDGQSVFIASKDEKDGASARLLDATTGQERMRFMGHYRCVAVDSEGMRLAAGDWGGNVRVWNIQSGEEICAMQTREHVKFVGFDPHGHSLLTTVFGDKTATWKIATGQRECEFQGAACGYALDGQVIVTWAISTTPLPGYLGQHVEFIVSNAASGKPLNKFSVRGGDVHVRAGNIGLVTTSERTLLVSSTEANYLWDLEKGCQINIPIAGHTGVVGCTALSGDGKQALTGSSDGTIHHWDVETGLELGILSGHTGTISSVAFDPDGSRALTSASDHTVRLWELGNHSQLTCIDEVNIQLAQFSTDGATVMTGGWQWASNTHGPPSTSIHLRNPADLSTKAALRFPPIIDAACVSSDGKYLCIASPQVGKPQIWDLQAGKKIQELDATGFNTAVFSSNGMRLLTSTYGGSLRLWNCESWTLLAEATLGQPGVEPGPGVAAVTSDGSRALYTSYGRIFLWDTDKNVVTKLSDSDPWSKVYALSFSAKRKTALSATSDGSIRLWDAQQGKLLKVFQHDALHPGFCMAVFSGDGKKIISTTGSETLVWRTDDVDDK